MPKTPWKTWTCGCGTALPAHIIFCSRCGKGQK